MAAVDPPAAADETAAQSQVICFYFITYQYVVVEKRKARENERSRPFC